jgi:hypothetical protein
VTAALVDDCVSYVPFAAFTGNPYMRLIWNDAHLNVVELRSVCEQIALDDPAGLKRMSDEQQGVAAYLATASQPSTIPPNCLPGSKPGDNGFCVADR